MKRFLISLLAICSVTGNLALPNRLLAQTLRAELNISPRPSTRLADWTSNRETATLVLNNSSEKPIDLRIDAKLSLNGSVIAQTRLGTMPILTIPPGAPSSFGAVDMFPENSVSFFGDLKTSTMRSGILPEGSYEICITLINATIPQPIQAPLCRSFFLAKFILPTLLQPENDRKIASGTEKTILFVWSPMMPIPPLPIMYRVRVSEVLSGQSALQAFNVNTPLFERTTTGTTALLWPQEISLPRAGDLLTWSVQPEDEHGMPIITPERFATPYSLIVLPSSEHCSELLQKLKNIRKDAMKIEEEYWVAFEWYARVTEFLEKAEEQADVVEIEKDRAAKQKAELRIEKIKVTYDATRSKYDSVIVKYEACIGK